MKVIQNIYNGIESQRSQTLKLILILGNVCSVHTTTTNLQGQCECVVQIVTNTFQ